MLDADAQRASEALSHFAWGLFLDQRPGRTSDDAMAEFRKALSLLPDSKVIMDHIVGPLMVNQQYGKLIDYLEPVARDNRDAAVLQMVLSQALVNEKRLPEACGILEEAIEATGWEDARLVRELSICYWRAEKYKEIEALLRRAFRKRSLRGRFVVHHAAAVYYHSLRQLPDEKRISLSTETCRERMLTHASRAADLIDQVERPSDVHSLTALLEELEAWDHAIAVNRYAVTQIKFTGVPAKLSLAKALQANSQAEEAAAILDELLADRVLPAGALPDVARLYMQQDNTEKAIVAYERLLPFAKTATRLRTTLAYLYLRVNSPDKAVRVLEAISRRDAEGHYLLSHAYNATEQKEKAYRAARLAASTAVNEKETDFFNVGFHLYFAGLCEEANRIDEAVEQAGKALALEPDNPVCLNFIGYVMADHNQELTKAEQFILRAVAAEPENMAYLDSLAWVYYRQKRYAEALPVILDAVRHSEEFVDSVILDHAGDICAKNSLDLLARRYWREALTATTEDAAEDAEAIRKKLDDPGPANEGAVHRPTS